VLIYFDEPTKRAVLARLVGQLATDGYFVIGAAETATGLSDDFMGVLERHHGIFRFTPEAAAMMEAREERMCATSAGAPLHHTLTDSAGQKVDDRT
jgi:chemotaxis protein methyltransferase CheR